MARISNKRSREIIDGSFEFAGCFTSSEHFGLMKIKDAKAKHFRSIRQTTHGSNSIEGGVMSESSSEEGKQD